MLPRASAHTGTKMSTAPDVCPTQLEMHHLASQPLTRGVHTRRVEVQGRPALEQPGVHVRRNHHPAWIKVHGSHGRGAAQSARVQGLGRGWRCLWSWHSPQGHWLRW